MAVNNYFVKVGKWTHHKFVEFGNNVKYVRDALVKVKGKDKASEISQGVTNSSQASFEQQIVKKYWQPRLHNFKSTLKGNASKAQQQLCYRSFQGKNTYFQNDFIWRRARKIHLVAFAGLFLFQEETQESQKKTDYQCRIYDNVCSHIKEFFPHYEEEQCIPDGYGNSLENFDLKPAEVVSNGIKYRAQLKPEEDAIEVCSESSSLDKDEVDNLSIKSTSDDVFPLDSVANWKDLYSNEYTVKMVYPRKGATSEVTMLKDSENELMCGGFGQFDILFGHQPKKKFPAHPNIVKVERAFIGDIDGAVAKSTVSIIPEPTKALYLVTKRYKSTLKSHLDQHHLTAEVSSLIILQLLEAVAHLEKHNIAHRDINSSNIFLEYGDEGWPRVLLGEFGNSYCADSVKDMKVPFQHCNLDTRLRPLSTQAPEISRARAGRFNSVNYSKSDAWSVGLVVQEILTGRNPFKDPDASGIVLDSRTYTDDEFPRIYRKDVSRATKVVAELLLKCDSKQRLSAGEAADIVHLDLFASPPSQNLPEDVKHEELRSWVISHCAEVFARKRRNSVLFQLCQTFFNRLDSLQLRQGFYLWMMLK